MLSKKGQGLSLNVIIVAAIALIVLVVLIMLFTGRIGIFQSQLGGEAKVELDSMRSLYGTCHPSGTAETTFAQDFNEAAELEDANEQQIGKSQARDAFRAEINRCKRIGNVDDCDGDAFCAWE